MTAVDDDAELGPVGRSIALGPRLTMAFDEARRLHADDVRKGTGVPYLAHLLAVSALVLEHGGDEDQAVAALLHDTAEDHGGEVQLAHIEATYGADVASIVRDLSDSLEEEGVAKAPWWTRKAVYLRHLADQATDRALLVSAADKLHNGAATLDDYRRDGDALWSRFNPDAGREGQRWYYRRLAEIFRDRGAPIGLVTRLEAVVVSLDAEVLRRHPELTDVDLQREHDLALVREHEALRAHDRDHR
ncbi:MAG: HD domain-containing protein [Acidimicrobiales bacterium]